ncbi:MAG: hypothetical protein Q9186_001963 [Xanthomendoza sp. 1 TL-2023]
MGKLDPNVKPPDSLKFIHKKYQRASADTLTEDVNVCDLSRVEEFVTNGRLRVVKTLEIIRLEEIFARFEGYNGNDLEVYDVKVYEHLDVPGLQFLPSLLPHDIQICLLSRLLNRDLTDARHKTNVHFHHTVLYDTPSFHSTHDVNSPNGSQKFSFFDCSPTSSSSFPALDPNTHNPLTVPHFLNRKLRWMTLGGQYDWTKKAYPTGSPPDFPKDIAQLIHDIFPNIRPEAAIVNFYTPGDTLSIHRDVSEESDVGLVSISLGCDAVFVAGLEDTATGELKYVVMRLKSGDAVYMGGPSRYAWHSVPQVLAGTCPEYLSEWPASSQSHRDAKSTSDDRFEAWRGWMANKRINLNIRQMRD